MSGIPIVNGARVAPVVLDTAKLAVPPPEPTAIGVLLTKFAGVPEFVRPMLLVSVTVLRPSVVRVSVVL